MIKENRFIWYWNFLHHLDEEFIEIRNKNFKKGKFSFEDNYLKTYHISCKYATYFLIMTPTLFETSKCVKFQLKYL